MERETISANQLNLIEISKKLTHLGLSQADLADKLGVSREAVSQWMKNEKFPRPKSLLGLARVLELPFESLVLTDAVETEPVVAFRKKARHDISPEYVSSAKENGQLLEGIVEFLPYDKLFQTRTLVDPKVEYTYVQMIAHDLREIMKVKSGEKITFGHLIGFFTQLRATLIPVFLGHKDAHENALHIYLPKSKSTWIYLNLDSNVCDFKFWMTHELGHVISPSLKGDEAEDFADCIAGAVLVDQEKAHREYLELRKKTHNVGWQINHIKSVASDLLVSPYTVYVEINKFADHFGYPEIELNSIHGATKNFEKTVPTIAHMIFKSEIPSPTKYMEALTDQFKTPFFLALKHFIEANKKGANFIHRILYLPLADAQQFHEEILQWKPAGS